MSPPLDVERGVARRFHRLAVGLDRPAADLATAFERLGWVQIDPINVCGRMHDLILRTRVAGYRAGDLLRHLHAPARPGFEHYLPGAGVLAALPAEAWPYLQERMEARRSARGSWLGRLTPPEAKLAGRILAEIADRGPLASDDIEHEGRADTGWGTQGRLAKVALDKLFAHGRVLITARRDFRRVYDLPERVLPAAVLRRPRPAPDETVRWAVVQRLRQRRLVRLRPAEARCVADLVQSLRVAGCPPLYCLREDLPLLARAERSAAEDDRPRLLAPLDPLIYDRALTARLWAFDYTWEVYTPPARRKRGYYALPVLAGDRLVGHLEPRADRERGRVAIISRRVARGVRTRAAVGELAVFLGLG